MDSFKDVLEAAQAYCKTQMAEPMFPAVVKVTCSVPLSRFKGLSEDMFSIHIPFEDLEQNVSGTLPVKLTKKPDWVHTATLLPDKVEFILEHNNKHD